MTEPLRNSSPDVPEYASYPAEPVAADSSQHLYSSASTDFSATSYDEQARKIGAALGRLVNRLNEMSAPVREKIGTEMSHLNDEVDLARSAAERTLHDASRKVAAGARQAMSQAQARAAVVRRQAAQTVDEYPLHTLAAAGVAGILLGVGLRAWRENRG